jgi:hypothetical protein
MSQQIERVHAPLPVALLSQLVLRVVLTTLPAQTRLQRCVPLKGLRRTPSGMRCGRCVFACPCDSLKLRAAAYRRRFVLPRHFAAGDQSVASCCGAAEPPIRRCTQ